MQYVLHSRTNWSNRPEIHVRAKILRTLKILSNARLHKTNRVMFFMKGSEKTEVRKIVIISAKTRSKILRSLIGMSLFWTIFIDRIYF